MLLKPSMWPPDEADGLSESLFDLTDQYDEMLSRGIRVSGETKDFFVRGRARSLLQKLPAWFRPKRILDFGCGMGETTHYLTEVFENAEVWGVDTAQNALHHARKRYGSKRLKFVNPKQLAEAGQFDLCYTNGVLHHVKPAVRVALVRRVHASMSSGGYFALFENNPWNPGTRLVMSRIPFDRDAQMLSPVQAMRLVREGGFAGGAAWWSLFHFPRALSLLRFADDALSHLPLGAQYCVLSVKS